MIREKKSPYHILMSCDGKTQEFLHLYRKCDEASKKKLYLHVLNEVKGAIEMADINKLKICCQKIIWISSVENIEILQAYFSSSNNTIKNTTPVILACKYKQILVLNYLLTNKNVLTNLSLNIGRRKILPTDEDNECHNAFYYAIRANNVDLLVLVHKWYKSSFEIEKLDEIMSKAFEELLLKNVLLSQETQIFVGKTLSELRFSSKGINRKKYISSLTNVKDRMDLLLENIHHLVTEYYNVEVDEQFLLVAKYVVQNIYILKQQLKCTYSVLPWEEVEFCLIAFIKSEKSFEDIHLIFKSLLSRKTIIKILDIFSHHLTKLKSTMDCKDLNKMSHIPNLKRSTVIANIIQNSPEFTSIYDIYRRIRDISSLNQMCNYINIALSADSEKQEDRVLIIRALQVLGEYVKNTLESPKLSDVTSELLLCSLQRNTREIVSGLRNSLSHVYSLSIRTELEHADTNLFACVVEDLKKVNTIILDVLLQGKIKAIRLLLNKVLVCEDMKEIQEISQMFHSINYKSIFSKRITGLHGKLEILIEQFRNTIDDETVYEKVLLNLVKEVIDAEKSKLEDMKTNYLTGLLMLQGMQLMDTDDIERNVTRFKTIAAKALEHFSSKMTHSTCQKIYIVLQQFENRMNQRMINDENIYRVKKILMYEMYHILEFEADNVKWIEELSNRLNTNKPKDSQKHQKNISHLKKDFEDSFVANRVQMLKDALQHTVLHDCIFSHNKCYMNQEKTEAIIEMLTLDIFSVLGDLKKCLLKNIIFLDDNFPMINGKSLRNYLAHGNALIGVLSCDVSFALLFNALMLTTKNGIKRGQNIGKFVEDNALKLKAKIDREILMLKNQKSMFIALSNGELDVVKICIENGADIHARDNSLWTSLHFAAKGSSLTCVKYVIDQKINIHEEDIHGNNPLHVAVKYGRKNIVQYLIEVEKLYKDVNITDDLGRTCLHLASQYGFKDLVNLLLQNKAATDKKDSAGCSPLHYAILYNHYDIAIILLQEEENVDTNETHCGYTSLHLCAENGNLQLINFLLKHNANVNALTDAFCTPMHLAVENRHTDIVQSLLTAGANVNAKTVHGYTPLHIAVDLGCEDIVRLLLQYGANVNAFDKNYFNFPVHHAAKVGCKGVVEILLQNRASINTKTTEGFTPLHFAAQNGHQSVVELLLMHNLSVNFGNNKGATPLHLSALHGHTNIVQKLIEHGANVNIKMMNNMTPLHMAVIDGMINNVKLLLHFGADINAIGDKGMVPLHLSCRNRYEDIVKYLVEEGAFLNEQDEEGMTPLHYASVNGLLQAAETLMENGACVDIKDENGLTPLHYGAMFGHRIIVKILLKRNTDVNAKDIFNLPPVYYAVHENHKDVLETLIDQGAKIHETNISTKRNLLYIATKNNNKDIVSVLLSKGMGLNTKEIQVALSVAVTAGFKDLVNILLKDKTVILNNSGVSGFSLLHFAIETGHKDVVQLLLRKGADANSISGGHITPLHAATQLGDREIVNMLLDHNADVMAKLLDGLTPLHLASRGGHSEVVKALLHNGASVNVKDMKKRTCVDLAVACGHLQVVKLLMEDNKIDFSAKHSFTLLHRAAQYGHLEVTKYLVIHGADTNAKNELGSKPIHIAARNGHTDIVNFYLSCKIKIEDCDVVGQTLLHYAVLGGQIETAKFLLKNNVNINVSDNNGSKPLHLASALGHQKVVKFLLENGAYYNDTDHSYEKPIEKAGSKAVSSLLKLSEQIFQCVKMDNYLQVEQCIKEGAAVDLVNANNVSLLHYATYKEYQKTVYILLKHNANPNINAKGGSKPLHYACEVSNFEIVQLLLFYGAVYNARTDHQKIPIDFAKHKKIIDLLKLVDESFNDVQNGNPKVIRDLIKINNANVVKCIVNAHNLENKSLIVSAVYYNFPYVYKLKEILQENISTQLNMVNIHFCNANYQEAFKILTCILEKRMVIFGIDNPSTWDIEKLIAVVFYKDHKYQNALVILEEIYKKEKEALGAENLYSISTKNEIAFVLHRLGRNKESLTIYEEIYQKQILGEKDFKFWSTCSRMALVLNDLKEFELALRMCKETCCNFKRILGANHPATLSVQNNIALILNKCGRNDEALKIYEEVYNTRSVVLGPHHQDTLRTRHNLGGVFLQQGKFNDALLVFNQVYEAQKLTLGPNHKDTLTTQVNVAEIFFLQKKFISALKIYVSTFERRKAILGLTHPDILETQQKIDTINFIWKKVWLNSVAIPEYNVEENIFDSAYNGNVKAVETYIHNGFDVNCKNSDGISPLHFAVSNGHKVIVKMFLENSCAVDVVTPEHYTPLHIAVSQGHRDIVEILLLYAKQEKCVKFSDFINAKTNSGATALHIVSDLEIAKLLLKFGAVYNLKNNEGKVPRDIFENQCIKDFFLLVDMIYEDAEVGNPKIVNKFLHLVPDEIAAVSNARNSEGKTFFQVIILNKYKSLAGMMLKIIK